jgi:Flp pilus assembly protein TadG
MLRSLWRNEEGTALVEGAVLLPVLMSLFFGVYEFSFFFYQQQLISTGVRDAARYVARSDLSACYNGSGVLNTSCSQLTTAESNATSIATTGVTSGGSSRVVGWSSVTYSFAQDANSGSSTPCGATACNGNASVYVLTVTASFPDPSLGLFGFLGLTAPTIVVSHSERVIGPG